ncbi:hypothetical protein WR25_21324 [Diploscapter pachys]|uniref:Syndecan n=1 Tax=Diploscapter pachys TaxID=2018661 RepID=A0A2A2J3F3_9BILA|nr:hypothetical protein WR25_21324 [Diploscapter pachys]
MRLPLPLLLLVFGSGVCAQKIEGSGSPPESNPGNTGNADLETHGSGGYSNDDEDGDDVQGSGGGPPPPNIISTSKPPLFISTTTSTARPFSPTTQTAIFRPVPVEKIPVEEPARKFDEAPTTATIPTMRTTPPRFVAPSTTPSPEDRSAFIPFHHMLKPGIFAAIVGGTIVGLLTAILLVMFIVYRMRKKDEGSYALDEPKPRHYGYSYQKAQNKEFYA